MIENEEDEEGEEEKQKKMVFPEIIILAPCSQHYSLSCEFHCDIFACRCFEG